MRCESMVTRPGRTRVSPEVEHWFKGYYDYDRSCTYINRGKHLPMTSSGPENMVGRQAMITLN